MNIIVLVLIVLAYLAVGAVVIAKYLGSTEGEAGLLPLMGVFVLVWPLIAVFGTLGYIADAIARKPGSR